ncbi:MAG: ABC transporter permease [Clostridium sp.]|nr:ABC transporter permease [Clostridium sp.]
MLTACLKSEQIKIKRSFIWAAFLLIPIIPAVMGVQNYLNNLDLLKNEWFSLWTQITLFYTDFFFCPLVAIYCSYLWRMENQNKNRHMLFTAPVKVSNIFFGKLIIVARITVMTQLWIFLLYLLAGKLVRLPGLPPALLFAYIVRGSLGGLVVAALQLVVSMQIRSFAAPIAVAVIGSITGFLASNSKYGIVYPYSLMAFGMNANKSEDMLSGNGIIFFLSCAVYFALFCGCAVWILKREDVKA